MNKAPNDVDSYIAEAPKDVQGKLKKLREIIRKAAPQAGEKISYRMPYYAYKGRLAYFAVFKKHIGLYIPPPVIAEHKKELKEYGTSMATVRFTLDKDLPAALIRKLIKARLKKNEEKGKKGSSPQSAAKKPKGKLTICSRGHKFYKSSGCPVCPICWPGRYKKLKSDFPDTLAAPALRALHNEKITSLVQLAKHTEAEIAKLHGIGPNAISKLREALKAKGLSFYAAGSQRRS